MCADVLRLPFRYKSARHVYCGHLLEHLELDAIPGFMREVRRVLDGELCVVGPDCDRQVDDPILADLMRYGGDRWPGDRHLWRSTATTTRALLADFDVEEIDIRELPDVWPCPHRHETWQFALVAR